MDGICAECGLEFEWWWMFRAQFHPWLFEHQWRAQPARSAFKTLCAVPRARCVCRQISLIHPIRLAPLIAMLLGVLLVALGMWAGGLAYVAHQGALKFGTRVWGGGLTYYVPIIIQEGLAQMAIFVLPVLVLPPLAFLFIPVSLQRIKVRPMHLARIWLYSLIGAAVIALLVAFPQMQWNLMSGLAVPMWMHPQNWRLVSWSPASPWWVYLLADTVRPIWIITLIWSWWWWRAACRDYLRLPDATLTATMLMIIVTLASYLVQHAVSLLQQLA